MQLFQSATLIIYVSYKLTIPPEFQKIIIFHDYN